MENVVQEIILVSVVLVLGLVIIGFTVSYLYPQIVLSSEEQTANNIASQTTLSVGPVLSGSSSTGSLVMEVYDPGVSGNVSVLAFVEPQSFETSVGLVTPPTSPNFKVYLPNGKPAYSFTSGNIYDLNGRLLVRSEHVYTVPFNQPFTISVNNFNSNDIVIIWVMYGQGELFRIGFTFTGVPSSGG
ncbi:hypothetical protein GWK48_00545 [Metallosphaera tengchongensis]|uniref:Uncharacterized protein n=1 Tax=Metallosphaera tengchongensis TaxID=1532350 RepID=A0A6N0NSB6_9CREN|nr:hypothetical protein [Metallosphaera tengchongensis]QKQ99084.1 hypothetical protein GWK48_00545 [Metallosphaera tengchongensis]